MHEDEDMYSKTRNVMTKTKPPKPPSDRKVPRCAWVCTEVSGRCPQEFRQIWAHLDTSGHLVSVVSVISFRWFQSFVSVISLSYNAENDIQETQAL